MSLRGELLPLRELLFYLSKASFVGKTTTPRQAECGERQIPTAVEQLDTAFQKKKTHHEKKSGKEEGGGVNKHQIQTSWSEARDSVQTHEDLISTLQDWDKLSLIQHLRLT